MAEHQIRRAVRRDVERTVQALPIRGSHGAITQGNKRVADIDFTRFFHEYSLLPKKRFFVSYCNANGGKIHPGFYDSPRVRITS